MSEEGRRRLSGIKSFLLPFFCGRLLPLFYALYSRLIGSWNSDQFFCLSLSSLYRSTGITDTYHYTWLFTWVPEIKFRLLGLHGKHFHPLTHHFSLGSKVLRWTYFNLHCITLLNQLQIKKIFGKNCIFSEHWILFPISSNFV